MSIFKRKGSPYFHFDFQLKGYRFRGSTGAKTARRAQKVEDFTRANAALDIASGKLHGTAPRATMTIDAAFERHFQEVSMHQSSARDTERQLATLHSYFGANTTLEQIDDNRILKFITWRRRHRTKAGEPIKAATVNREIELLRRIMKRASKHWRAQIGEEPSWCDLLLEEPEGRKRELLADEERALFVALYELRPDYAPLVEFALTTGLRLAACQRLTWADVDSTQRVARVRMKSKKPGGRLLELPLPEAAMQILCEQRGRHPIFAFTYVCKKSRGQRKAGERYPFSKNGWRKDWSKVLSLAGVKDFRFHDLRHTAASRVQRAVGNLRVTQQMLGHASIQSTVRYAHVQAEEVRQAMEEAFPHNRPHKDMRRNVK